MDGLRHEPPPRLGDPQPDELPEGHALWAEEGQRVAPCWRHVDWRPVDYVRLRDIAPRAPVDHTWHRFRPHATYNDPFIDARRALFLIDALAHWPASKAQGVPFAKLPFFAPNIDLTVQFHRDSASADWLFVESISPLAADRLVSTQARVWSRDGQLLASGTSTLRCRPNPWYDPD